MAFLIKKDFEIHIQKDNLDQILGGNDYYLDECIKIATSEASSYLAQRYYIEKIFISVEPFSLAKHYNLGDVVWGSHVAWSNSVVYTLNALVSYQGRVYRKNNDFVGYVAGVLPTNGAYFEYIYDNEKFYSVVNLGGGGILKYDNNKNYSNGDVVKYYFDLFTCISRTVSNNIPTDIKYWIGNGAQTSIGDYPYDPFTSWLNTDVRNPQLKACLIDIALYHLHSRINPRNIPELRKERYDGNSPEQKGGAIGWLKNVAHGLVNADLPERIDFQLPISWGSYEKQNNNF